MNEKLRTEIYLLLLVLILIPPPATTNFKAIKLQDGRLSS